MEQLPRAVITHALPGVITIPAGSATASITVGTLADALVESSESLQIELVEGAGYTVGLISERTSQAIIQNVGTALPGGTTITPTNLLANFTRSAYFLSDYTHRPVQFHRASGYHDRAGHRWDAQLRLPYNAAIAQGDVLWAEFWVRSLTGTGNITSYPNAIAIPIPRVWIEASPSPALGLACNCPLLHRRLMRSAEPAWASFWEHRFKRCSSPISLSRTMDRPQHHSLHALSQQHRRNLRLYVGRYRHWPALHLGDGDNHRDSAS